jgi:5S rRNA maturation endonuclease (ribonuclease M5)
MMDDCERLEEIEAALVELSDRARSGAIILVEGRRDREALDQIGIRGEIIMTSQKQLFNLCEELARSGTDVVVLTDWDERGEEVAGQIRVYMEADGGHPDLIIRETIKGLVRKEIKDVESLYKYLVRLREVCASKPQPY